MTVHRNDHKLRWVLSDLGPIRGGTGPNLIKQTPIYAQCACFRSFDVPSFTLCAPKSPPLHALTVTSRCPPCSNHIHMPRRCPTSPPSLSVGVSCTEHYLVSFFFISLVGILASALHNNFFGLTSTSFFFIHLLLPLDAQLLSLTTVTLSPTPISPYPLLDLTSRSLLTTSHNALTYLTNSNHSGGLPVDSCFRCSSAVSPTC